MVEYPLVGLVVLMLFAAALVAAAAEDIRTLLIPNRLPLAIVLLYPAHVLAAPIAVDWLGAVAVAGASLAVGFLLFVRRWAGGGDVKLFVAVSLWAGPALFPSFVMVTALAGAAIGLGMIAHRRLLQPRLAATRGDPSAGGAAAEPAGRRHELPYGVAIAAGGLHLAATLLIGG